MSLISLPDISGLIQASHVNNIRGALRGVLVGRGATGTAESGQDLGSSAVPFGTAFLESVKSGATQAAAGAAADELWSTDSHTSLPDHVLMIGV